MNKLLTIILCFGICVNLFAQERSIGDTSPETYFKYYMELKTKGKYEESDKWMNKFAELRPNDLRTLDYKEYRSDLKFLMLDNGNYTIAPLKFIKSLKIKKQIDQSGILKDRSIAVLSKSYAIKHPYLTPDRKILYFDSDMPGGYGKSDIYRISRKKDGSWGKPENLGDKVNTEGDELYPFYKEEGQILFFSSNGRYGLGGLDIFIYAINFSGFGKVYNAGYPLNSQYDDFALTADDHIKQGYFKSNRSKGKGSVDLYSVIFH